jgi:hypothetical protein
LLTRRRVIRRSDDKMAITKMAMTVSNARVMVGEWKWDQVTEATDNSTMESLV